MSKIIRSSVEACPCPPTGYSPGPDVVAVDYIDGYPGEYGEFTFNADDVNLDRGTSYDADIRTLLGLPDAPTGVLTAKFRYGSMIKVSETDIDYYKWKAFRYDCGNSKYTCEDEVTAFTNGNTIELLPNPLDKFVNDDGELDLNCDQLNITHTAKLNETVGANGTIFDGGIPNYLYVDPAATYSDSRFNGIPQEAAFNAYIDEYGIIHSAAWTIIGDVLDITWMTKDPRIPGVPPTGRIIRTGNKLRVWKTGIITIIRQQIKSVPGGIVILGQGIHQEVGEFQTTFGCGDTTLPINPFVYSFINMITDSVEFISGTEIILSDPPTEEYIWYPQTINNSDGQGFALPGQEIVPLTQLPRPS